MLWFYGHLAHGPVVDQELKFSIAGLVSYISSFLQSVGGGFFVLF